jgi:hypothetical protein
VTRWLRAFLLVAAVQGYVMGVSGLLAPERIIGFPLQTTPLNDRFVASFYIAGAIGLTLTALAPRADDMRVLLTAFSFVTVLLLVLTLVYWSEFTADGVPYGWLISYVFDPVVGGAAIVGLGLWSTDRLRTRGIGLLLLAEAAVFVALGLVLTISPATAIDIWPWKLTVILARVYGSIFLALGLGAVLAARESRVRAVLPFVATSFVFAACGLAVYALHRSRFDGSTATAVWVCAHVLGVLGFGGALLVLGER